VKYQDFSNSKYTTYVQATYNAVQRLFSVQDQEAITCWTKCVDKPDMAQEYTL